MMKRAVPAKAGLWSIDGDTVARVAGRDVGPAIVAVPSEQVPAIVVDLPAARSRRREALAAAVVPHIAAAPDTVHVATGPGPAPNTVVAALVEHDVMRRWIAAVGAAGLDHAAVVPDALLLPVPPAGSWTVAVAAGRVRVRTDDGGGFAVAEANFAAAWALGGRMPCAVVDAVAPAGLPPEAVRHGPSARAPRLTVDLRQGPYARRGQGVARVRRLGLIVAGGVLAHTAVAAADTVKLRALTDAQRQAHASTGHRADFLPLMTRASAALAGRGGADLVALDFTGERLVLRVAGPPAPVYAALRSARLDAVVVESAS